MAVRKSTGACVNCGGGTGRGSGGKKGGKGMWWVVGIAALVLYSNSQGESGSKDYQPPKNGTSQSKCDPDALISLGC